MPDTMEILPSLPIPAHLVGEVQSKLAYVDEAVARGDVSPSGDQITLYLRHPLESELRDSLQEKVQRVVTSMVKGAFRPKVLVLEDFLDRPAGGYTADPHEELLRRGELSQEANGVYVLGPLLTRLIAWFEARFVELADSFGAAPYRFPTLIPAKYMERVDYFSAFPHSLSFATHLRTDLDAIDRFAQRLPATIRVSWKPRPIRSLLSAPCFPQRCATTCISPWLTGPCRAGRWSLRQWGTASATRRSTWFPWSACGTSPCVR